jgi:plasmid stability protein
MATLTIRNIDDSVKERLRIMAATHGHSMEEEARLILKRAVGGTSGRDLVELSRQLFGGVGGIVLDAPSRQTDRFVPSFDEEDGRGA